MFYKIKPKSLGHNSELPAWDTLFFNTRSLTLFVQKISNKSDEDDIAVNTSIQPLVSPTFKMARTKLYIKQNINKTVNK